MNWAFWREAPALAPEPAPSPPPIDPAAFAMVANAPSFNPTDAQQVTFAHYRADAIARDHEQRAARGDEPHPERERMRAEAMSYAWMLVGAGKWTMDHLRALETRLGAD